MAYQGYYGTSHDRYSFHNEQSTLHKMKETYWTTKQVVMRKLGKKEDEHIVASDSQLDSKLEVFKAIQKSCMDLLRVIEKYQDRLCALSQEENGMGRFLKAQSQHDKTRAGKMMGAVGKAQSFSSQQRLALRVPLVRLYQEVETFRYRAISDTLMTINRMERARTEYRGALLWMKDVSEELDPDTYKQLEKFRKVQAQVKKTKAQFDKLKLDTMQKIDLLAASRCNMFSHVLANYQSTLLHFWEKTSRTMSAVAESFKGYQYYEFSMLKELTEPAKKLADETATEEDEDKSEFTDTTDESSSRKNGLISFDEDAAAKSEEGTTDMARLLDKEVPPPSAEVRRDEVPGLGPFIDFGDDEEPDIEEIKRRQDEEFDFSGKILASREDRKLKKETESSDLLSEELEIDDLDKDDMTLLNEIMNAPSSGGDDFSQQWQAVFGAGGAPHMSASTSSLQECMTSGESEPSIADFLPSHLLNSMTLQQGVSTTATGVPGITPAAVSSTGTVSDSKTDSKPMSKKEKKTDMSAWFNLFADLDPLANPDAIGRKAEEPTDAI